MSKGLLVILSGPTGVGKGSIRLLVNADTTLKMEYSISVTTRKPREFEQEGRDYFFVSRDMFQKLIEMDDLLEWSVYDGEYYGTRKSWIREKMERGENVSIELDPKGAAEMIDKIDSPNVISFFIVPESLDSMRNSMEYRGHPDIEERLSKVQADMKYRDRFDYIVLNNPIQKAADLIRNIVLEADRNKCKAEGPKGKRLPAGFKTDLF